MVPDWILLDVFQETNFYTYKSKGIAHQLIMCLLPGQRGNFHVFLFTMTALPLLYFILNTENVGATHWF